jgi:hypothetical protein
MAGTHAKKRRRFSLRRKTRTTTPSTATELKRYNKCIAIFELIGIPALVVTLFLVGSSHLWSILSTTLYVMIGVFGIVAIIGLIGAIIFRFKRWNNHQNGFRGLILPVIYIVLVYYMYHFAHIYLVAAKQFHMYS